MAKSASSGFNSAVILKILVIILFIGMGICGYVSGSDVAFAGAIYSEIGEEWLTYTISTILLIAGLGLLAPMFVKGMPAVIEKVSMIGILIFWVAVIIFKEFVPGFSGMDFEGFLNWIMNLSVDLIIFFAVLGVCSKALK
ncbi:MAG: hypothetical protein PHO44_06770 [Sphaerochaetaceae bacterium]|jgi:hypothetical protein|nr:hypothetical protein [Sphaerochaetaceae bacterium]MDD3163994.1 hypothetical protein [Sphaerochaetaceae bacterium]MDD4007667.1 hypothetical protein [Sphaerochaetaceae bacterium]MDD4397678.1 hypothetical protein [Sphaerochaetaceae bacterium]